MVVVLGGALPGVAGAAPGASIRPIVFQTRMGELAKINPDGTGRTVIAGNPNDEGILTIYHSPDLSADGTKVVFGECHVSYAPRAQSCWLNVVNVDGSGFRTVRSSGSVSPRWSPDGLRIAYSPVRDGASKIIVVNEDGSGEKIIAEGSDPDWSPDGSQIVFSVEQLQRTSDDPPRGALFIVPADGSRRARQLTRTFDTAPGGATWSPDGKTIAFWVNGQVALVNANGEKVRKGPVEKTRGGRVAWSPDSRRLAIADQVGDSNGTYPLYIHDLVTGTARLVTDDGGDDVGWS